MKTENFLNITLSVYNERGQYYKITWEIEKRKNKITK